MDVTSLIQLMQNKESVLSSAVGQAYSSGDLERMNALQKELYETQNTLSQLRLLADINHAAAASNSTPADVVASGVDAVLNTVQGPSAGAVINGYDISAYATDPLYEQKIQAILAAMPDLPSADAIDAYIQAAAPGSPVTGLMVANAAALYAVDVPLMTAIMQNDSNFGLLGVGARTNNPGNVGNTGTEERTYASWDDGVTAVAEWLSRHRYIPQEAVIVPPAETVVESTATDTTADVVVKPKKKKTVVEDPVPDTPVPPPDEATTTPPTVDAGSTDATSTPPVPDAGSSDATITDALTATSTEPAP